MPQKPKDWAEYDACADHFRAAMVRKLIANQHKGGRAAWLRDEPLWLLRRLRHAVDELEQALSFGRPDVLSEAADVGNRAMMIADVAGALGAPRRGEPQEP